MFFILIELFKMQMIDKIIDAFSWH